MHNLATILLLLFSNVLFAESFLWYVNYDNVRDVIEVSGVFGEQNKQISIEDGSAVRMQFEELYTILEKRKRGKRKHYEQTITQLSEQMLHPFSEWIAESDRIIVHLGTQIIRFPLEYLELQGQAIALQKPLIFRLGNDLYSSRLHFEKQNGSMVSNKSADPQRACKAVHSLFPNTSYFDSKTILPSSLESYPIEILLISTHGYTEPQNNRGVLGWRKVHFQGEQLKEMNPIITYIDACQQGINLKYLEVLMNNGSTNFYISPIISNDSGGSSTRTIKGFFKRIKTGLSPSYALFETKKDLNQRYRHFFRHKIVRLSKANCFRVYIL